MRKIWKKITVLLLAGMMLTVFTSCSRTEDDAESGSQGQEDIEHEYRHVEITIKDYGTIKLELDATVAPITVENFIKLAEEGFYDGLTFHRVIKGFMIQGGDPQGDGYGGSKETIKGEFSNNGVKNDLKHTRGAISMARSKKFDSASSQFFIVHQDSPHLDGDYACFGYVTEGIETVDAICDTVPVVEDSDGMVLKKNQPVIESVKVID